MTEKAKRACQILAFLIAALIAAELVLRFIFGLGNPPLFESSDVYGYRLAPNQDIRRFGNRIFYNAQGLRSEPITPKPSAGTTRILCLGDSITYGGSIIDQEETYPYQLETILKSKSPQHFEVLNASAPSWSLRDEESYILNHGIYNSHIVILQLSKDDLFQERCDKNLVGNSPNYPSRKPILALQEIFVKYLPRALPVSRPKSSVVKRSATVREENQLKFNLARLEKIKNHVDAMGDELIVVFIGSRMEDVYDMSFVESGKKQLFETINMLGIELVNLDEKFSSSEGDRLLRDKIHPNVDGNEVIAEVLAEFILEESMRLPEHQIEKVHRSTRIPVTGDVPAPSGVEGVTW